MQIEDDRNAKRYETLGASGSGADSSCDRKQFGFLLVAFLKITRRSLITARYRPHLEPIVWALFTNLPSPFDSLVVSRVFGLAGFMSSIIALFTPCEVYVLVSDERESIGGRQQSLDFPLTVLN